MGKEELPDGSQIKLVITDLDGTLLNPEGRVSERTKAVVGKVLQKYPDLHFVLASGRARPATQQIRQDLGIVERPHTESLLSNGCVIYDEKGKIVWQNTIPTEFFIQAHQLLKPSPDVVYMYSVGDDAFTFEESWAHEIKAKYEEQTVTVQMDEFLPKIESGQIKVNKFCFLTHDPSEADRIKGVLEELRKQYQLECAYSSGTFLDYMPHHTNKGAGLVHLLDRLNLQKEQVLAFGDGDNDLELFQEAGWPVAMANASEKLKQRARLLTKTNVEDGEADMLERIFLKEEQLN